MVCWWLLGLAVGGRASMPVSPGAYGAGSRADTLALLPVLLVAVVFAALLLRIWRSKRLGATGLARPPVWWCDARVVGAPLFALAGALLAQAARTEQQSCRARLAAAAQAGDTLQVLVDDVAAGRGQRGSFVRGVAELPSRPALQSCAVPATLRWYGALPRPGQRLPAPGVVTTTARGLRIEQTLVRGLAPGDESAATSPAVTRTERDLLRSWRGHLGESIDHHFRSRAPLVRALLIADQDGIDPALRDRYADAGLVHMLSVSGMHVAIIASALLTLGGMLRVPRRWLEPAALSLVCAYVLLLGAPAPAVRSAIMLAVVTLAARWQRPVHEWTALALGALVPTHNPLVMSDLGYQLSVSGMAALVAARAARRRWRHWAREQVLLRSRSLALRSRDAAKRHASHRVFSELIDERAREFAVNVAHWRGLKGWLVTECLTGCVATMVTAPLIAWTFGRISLVAPLSNLAAAPIVGLLQPALFLALAWAMLFERWPGLAIWLPDATQPFMAALDALAAWTAQLPFAVWPVAPSLAVAVGAGATMAVLVRSTASRAGTRDATRWRIGAASVAAATLWWAAADAQGLTQGFTQRLFAVFGGPGGARGVLEMHVLDVGQGDAVALRTPRGRWVLVDAGPRWQGGDAGRRTVVPHLRRRGGELALFVLSHAHDDHAGGAASVVQALKPHLWWESAWVGTSPGYREALTQLHRKGLRWQRVRPGQSLTLDGVHVDVLAPDSTWTAAQHDANETSVVLRVRHGAHRFLLTGDAEGEEEAWLLSRYTPDDLRADVLKVGHHGSRTSSSPALLDAVTPRVALASLGAGNRYGHPALETLEAFLARGVPVLRTDLEGAIVVRSDGQNLEVESRGERWRVP
jgi:competence protein ComEC